MNNKITELITTLKESGADDPEIALIISEVSQMSAMELYTYLLSLVEEKDRAELEKVADNEQVYQQKMAQLFEQYTGKSIQQVMAEIQSRLINKFLDEFEDNSDLDLASN